MEGREEVGGASIWPISTGIQVRRGKGEGGFINAYTYMCAHM